MSEAKEKWIRGKVIAPLAVLALASLATTVVPGGWKWVFQKCSEIGTWLISPATVPVWLLVILSILAVVVIVVGGALLISLFSSGAHYDEDTFFGVRWRWRYGRGGITGLACFCPHCDLEVTPLRASMYSAIEATLLRCEDCNKELGKFDCGEAEIQNRVTRKIQQKIRAKS